MEEKIITKSADETRALASNFASTMKGGEVLLLYGDLGSGKTTFTQGLAEALGVNKRIISPTFIIMREYDLLKKAGDAEFLYHVDLYRAESEKDIQALGLLELLGKKENIVIIEWPEKLLKDSIKGAVKLNFKFIDESTRDILIKNE